MEMKKIIGLLAASVLALGLSAGANAASEEYKAAMKQADADYHTAKAHCDTLSGTEKDGCMKQAKADHKSAEAQAKTKK
jgi:hypothetical protein